MQDLQVPSHRLLSSLTAFTRDVQSQEENELRVGHTRMRGGGDEDEEMQPSEPAESSTCLRLGGVPWFEDGEFSVEPERRHPVLEKLDEDEQLVGVYRVPQPRPGRTRSLSEVAALYDGTRASPSPQRDTEPSEASSESEDDFDESSSESESDDDEDFNAPPEALEPPSGAASTSQGTSQSPKTGFNKPSGSSQGSQRAKTAEDSKPEPEKKKEKKRKDGEPKKHRPKDPEAKRRKKEDSQQQKKQKRNIGYSSDEEGDNHNTPHKTPNRDGANNKKTSGDSISNKSGHPGASSSGVGANRSDANQINRKPDKDRDGPSAKGAAANDQKKSQINSLKRAAPDKSSDRAAAGSSQQASRDFASREAAASGEGKHTAKGTNHKTSGKHPTGDDPHDRDRDWDRGRAGGSSGGARPGSAGGDGSQAAQSDRARERSKHREGSGAGSGSGAQRDRSGAGGGSDRVPVSAADLMYTPRERISFWDREFGAGKGPEGGDKGPKNPFKRGVDPGKGRGGPAGGIPGRPGLPPPPQQGSPGKFKRNPLKRSAPSSGTTQVHRRSAVGGVAPAGAAAAANDRGASGSSHQDRRGERGSERDSETRGNRGSDRGSERGGSRTAAGSMAGSGAGPSSGAAAAAGAAAGSGAGSGAAAATDQERASGSGGMATSASGYGAGYGPSQAQRGARMKSDGMRMKLPGSKNGEGGNSDNNNNAPHPSSRQFREPVLMDSVLGRTGSGSQKDLPPVATEAEAAPAADAPEPELKRQSSGSRRSVTFTNPPIQIPDLSRSGLPGRGRLYPVKYRYKSSLRPILKRKSSFGGDAGAAAGSGDLTAEGVAAAAPAAPLDARTLPPPPRTEPALRRVMSPPPADEGDQLAEACPSKLRATRHSPPPNRNPISRSPSDTPPPEPTPPPDQPLPDTEAPPVPGDTQQEPAQEPPAQEAHQLPPQGWLPGPPAQTPVETEAMNAALKPIDPRKKAAEAAAAKAAAAAAPEHTRMGAMHSSVLALPAVPNLPQPMRPPGAPPIPISARKFDLPPPPPAWGVSTGGATGVADASTTGFAPSCVGALFRQDEPATRSAAACAPAGGFATAAAPAAAAGTPVVPAVAAAVGGTAHTSNSLPAQQQLPPIETLCAPADSTDTITIGSSIPPLPPPTSSAAPQTLPPPPGKTTSASASTLPAPLGGLGTLPPPPSAITVSRSDATAPTKVNSIETSEPAAALNSNVEKSSVASPPPDPVATGSTPAAASTAEENPDQLSAELQLAQQRISANLAIRMHQRPRSSNLESKDGSRPYGIFNRPRARPKPIKFPSEAASGSANSQAGSHDSHASDAQGRVKSAHGAVESDDKGAGNVAEAGGGRFIAPIALTAACVGKKRPAQDISQNPVDSVPPDSAAKVPRLQDSTDAAAVPPVATSTAAAHAEPACADQQGADEADERQMGPAAEQQAAAATDAAVPEAVAASGADAAAGAAAAAAAAATSAAAAAPAAAADTAPAVAVGSSAEAPIEGAAHTSNPHPAESPSTHAHKLANARTTGKASIGRGPARGFATSARSRSQGVGSSSHNRRGTSPSPSPSCLDTSSHQSPTPTPTPSLPDASPSITAAVSTSAQPPMDSMHDAHASPSHAQDEKTATGAKEGSETAAPQNDGCDQPHESPAGKAPKKSKGGKTRRGKRGGRRGAKPQSQPELQCPAAPSVDSVSTTSTVASQEPAADAETAADADTVAAPAAAAVVAVQPPAAAAAAAAALPAHAGTIAAAPPPERLVGLLSSGGAGEAQEGSAASAEHDAAKVGVQDASPTAFMFTAPGQPGGLLACATRPTAEALKIPISGMMQSESAGRFSTDGSSRRSHTENCGSANNALADAPQATPHSTVSAVVSQGTSADDVMHGPKLDTALGNPKSSEAVDVTTTQETAQQAQHATQQAAQHAQQEVASSAPTRMTTRRATLGNSKGDKAYSMFKKAVAQKNHKQSKDNVRPGSASLNSQLPSVPPPPDTHEEVMAIVNSAEQSLRADVERKWRALHSPTTQQFAQRLLNSMNLPMAHLQRNALALEQGWQEGVLEAKEAVKGLRQQLLSLGASDGILNAVRDTLINMYKKHQSTLQSARDHGIAAACAVIRMQEEVACIANVNVRAGGGSGGAASGQASQAQLRLQKQAAQLQARAQQKQQSQPKPQAQSQPKSQLQSQPKPQAQLQPQPQQRAPPAAATAAAAAAANVTQSQPRMQLLHGSRPSAATVAAAQSQARMAVAAAAAAAQLQARTSSAAAAASEHAQSQRSTQHAAVRLSDLQRPRSDPSLQRRMVQNMHRTTQNALNAQNQTRRSAPTVPNMARGDHAYSHFVASSAPMQRMPVKRMPSSHMHVSAASPRMHAPEASPRTIPPSFHPQNVPEQSGDVLTAVPWLPQQQQEQHAVQEQTAQHQVALPQTVIDRDTGVKMIWVPDGGNVVAPSDQLHAWQQQLQQEPEPEVMHVPQMSQPQQQLLQQQQEQLELQERELMLQEQQWQLQQQQQPHMHVMHAQPAAHAVNGAVVHNPEPQWVAQHPTQSVQPETQAQAVTTPQFPQQQQQQQQARLQQQVYMQPEQPQPQPQAQSQVQPQQPVHFKQEMLDV